MSTTTQPDTPAAPTMPEPSDVVREQVQAVEKALTNAVEVIQNAIATLQAAEPQAETVAAVGDGRLTLENTTAELLEDILSGFGGPLLDVLKDVREWTEGDYLTQVTLNVMSSRLEESLRTATFRRMFQAARRGVESERDELLEELRRSTHAVVDGRLRADVLEAWPKRHAPRFAEVLGVTTEELLSVVPSLDWE